MGTPHRGSDESKFGLVIARTLGFFRLQSNPDILRSMEHDSPELGEMHQRFEAISQNVMGANFYEARKFRSFLGLRWTYVSTVDYLNMHLGGLYLQFRNRSLNQHLRK